MLWTEKRWQFVGVVADEALVVAAIAHLGYMGLAFAYAVDRRTGRHRRFELKTPLALGAVVGLEPGAPSRLSTPQGLIAYDPRNGKLDLELWEFRAHAVLAGGRDFSAAWDVPGGGAHRTVKRMGDPASGVLYLNGETIPLAGAGLLDWSRGEPGRETDWRWSAGVGRAGDRVIAWNLRTGFGDPKGLENAIWIDGRPQEAGAATIEPGATWRVEVGDMALAFTPEGEQREDLDLGLLASRYHQPWGAYVGHFEGVPITGYGVAEAHWARW